MIYYYTGTTIYFCCYPTAGHYRAFPPYRHFLSPRHSRYLYNVYNIMYTTSAVFTSYFQRSVSIWVYWPDVRAGGSTILYHVGYLALSLCRDIAIFVLLPETRLPWSYRTMWGSWNFRKNVLYWGSQ